MAYKEQEVSKLFWISFSTLSVAYVASTFYFGEIKGNVPWLFQNVKSSAIAFVIVLVLGLVGTWLLDGHLSQYVPTIWNAAAIVTSLYPFVFFVLFILVLRRSSKEIDTDIESRTSELEGRCTKLENDVKQLSSIHQISIEVDGLPEQSANPLPPQRQLPAGSKKKKKSNK